MRLTEDQRQRLRSPRGQLALLAGTLALALVLAVIVAANRWFFERYVRERYPEPSQAARQAADALQAGQASAAAVRSLAEADRVGLYHVWMRSEATPAPALARALVAADEARARALVERTLAAGSPAQRRRAAELAGAAGGEGWLPLLDWARERAHAQQDAALLASLDRAREQVAARAAGK